MALILGISIAAAVPVAWFFLRDEEKPQQRRNARKPTVKTKVAAPAKTEPLAPAKRQSFKGASIRPGDECCQAALDINGKRFLVEEAPRLPLEGCDRIDGCACSYNNHSDRRSGEDRRDLYGSLSSGGVLGDKSKNQRTGMDRRSSTDIDFDDIEFEN